MYNPLVSIIIPVHNTELFVENTIKSVQNNGYENLEIVCINNGSTDNSLNIIEQLSEQDSRIKIMNLECSDVSAARNRGIKEASGKYIFCVDSDDDIKSGAIQTCINYLEENNADIICFNADVYVDGKRSHTLFGTDYFKKPLLICYAKDYDYAVNFTNTWQCIIKRDFIIQNNILFPEGRIYEDWVFLVNLFVKNPYSIFLKKSFYNYHMHTKLKQLSFNVSMKCLDSINAYLDAKQVLESNDINPYWLIVNDRKILHFASNFINYKLINSKKFDIINLYCTKLSEVINNMNTLYFYSLLKTFKTVQNITLDLIKNNKKISWFNIIYINVLLFIQRYMKPNMNRDLNEYIKQVNFDKQYKKLIKKFKNKKVVIYGGGQLFRIIYSMYDLSKLNIVGICDRSFDISDEEKFYMGYNKILLENLKNCDADVILTGTLEYVNLIKYLKNNFFENRKIIIKPLIYLPTGVFLKELIFKQNKE